MGGVDSNYEVCVSEPPKSYHLKIIPSAFSIRKPERVLASYPRFENSGGMSLKQFVIPGLTKLSTLYLTNAIVLH
jgi:hypothetical protein